MTERERYHRITIYLAIAFGIFMFIAPQIIAKLERDHYANEVKKIDAKYEKIYNNIKKNPTFITFESED